MASSSKSYYNGSEGSANDEMGDELLDAVSNRRTKDALEILKQDLTHIQYVDDNDNNAFHIAARDGSKRTITKIVDLFFERKEYQMLTDALNQRNIDNDTPLYVAILEKHHNTAHELVVADRTAVDNLYQIKSVSAGSGTYYDTELADMQMAISRLNVTHGNDDTDWVEDLHRAVGDGDRNAVYRILKDVDPDLLKEENEKGWNSVHVAAANGKVKTLNDILSFVNGSEKSELLCTPTKDGGNTPLHLAVIGGHETTTKCLMELEPKVASKLNLDNQSPLSLAVKGGNSTLLQHIAMAKISSGRVREELLQHAKNMSLAHAALKTKKPAVVKAIMEGFPELITSKDKEGRYPLGYAAYKGYSKSVGYLCKRFPDCIRRYDKDNSTALHKAVAEGNLEIVDALLCSCPKAIKDLDKKKRNVMEIAYRHGRQDIISYLKNNNFF